MKITDVKIEKFEIELSGQGSDGTYQDVYCKAELKSWE